MKSKEVETWYYKGAEPTRKITVITTLLTDEQFIEIDKMVNAVDKLSYKYLLRYLNCQNIKHASREENGIIN